MGFRGCKGCGILVWLTSQIVGVECGISGFRSVKVFATAVSRLSGGVGM